MFNSIKSKNKNMNNGKKTTSLFGVKSSRKKALECMLVLSVISSSLFVAFKSDNKISSDGNVIAGMQLTYNGILTSSENTFNGHIDSIKHLENQSASIKTSISSIEKDSYDSDKYWIRIKKNSTEIDMLVSQIKNNISKMRSIDSNQKTSLEMVSRIHESSEQLSTFYLSPSGNLDAYAKIQEISRIAERIEVNMPISVNLRKNGVIDIKSLSEDFSLMGNLISELKKSEKNDRVANIILSSVDDNYQLLSKSISLILNSSVEIEKNSIASKKIFGLASDSLSASKEMNFFDDVEKNRSASDIIKYALFAISIVLALLVLILKDPGGIRGSVPGENNEVKRTDDANFDDIDKLMAEIQPIEFGDLTVDFTGDKTVMKGITGGIRTSFKEAITALKNAVETMKKTSLNVKHVVSVSVQNSNELDDASKKQSKEVLLVVNNVHDLSQAISNVTENTLKAAEITREAKLAANEAADVVSRTNEKMMESRLRIQEVLKSAKHQGETSHEISQIIEAIESITDRTQVIAVNASLEAAKAGISGSGFQLLAGEINRLAETSSELLINITALVSRNKDEVAQTIFSVEAATNSVVDGANLANEANTELLKISKISEEVANFVDDIRIHSVEQSNTAKVVNESMKRLSKIAEISQQKVDIVVKSVREIDSSMELLQETASAFKTK